MTYLQWLNGLVSPLGVASGCVAGTIVWLMSRRRDYDRGFRDGRVLLRFETARKLEALGSVLAEAYWQQHDSNVRDKRPSGDNIVTVTAALRTWPLVERATVSVCKSCGRIRIPEMDIRCGCTGSNFRSDGPDAETS